MARSFAGSGFAFDGARRPVQCSVGRPASTRNHEPGTSNPEPNLTTTWNREPGTPNDRVLLMPKWFTPAAVLCGLMFTASPFIIANAPFESTMGLVYKIFYYHMPSAWMFLVSAVVCGIASARYLAT